MAPVAARKPRKTRPHRKTSKQEITNQFPEFELPYFAHQRLDPAKYSPSVGLPTGKPGWAPAPKEIATATNGGWGDDADAPFEVDSNAESDAESHSTLSTKRKHPHRADGTSYKRLRVPGGRPAVAKKVTADLDSDDELIVRMKNAKYLEKDIAQRLVEEGRVAYHPKTIGTRWARLRKALEQRQDELLDAELTDWHEGDDEVLFDSVRRADEIVAKAKADAENRRWRIVADIMKTVKPVVSFSQNACRSRYADLQTGTARPTPESVKNPDEETLRRIQSRLDKEQMINDDSKIFLSSPLGLDNIEGNGWTSKSKKYF